EHARERYRDDRSGHGDIPSDPAHEVGEIDADPCERTPWRFARKVVAMPRRNDGEERLSGRQALSGFPVELERPPPGEGQLEDHDGQVPGPEAVHAVLVVRARVDTRLDTSAVGVRGRPPGRPFDRRP